MDLLVLYMASMVAVLGDHQLWRSESNRLLAVAFPLLVLVLAHARRAGEEQLNGSLLETTGRLLASIALASLILITADTVLKGTHVLLIAVRLWVFSAAALVIAQALLGFGSCSGVRVPGSSRRRS